MNRHTPAVFLFSASVIAFAACNTDPPPTPETNDAGDVADGGADIGVPDIPTMDDTTVVPDVGLEVGCDTLGCPCDTDAECASGYCIEGVEPGEFVCSEFCDIECSDPSFECVLLENSGGDSVRICVPSADRQCQPCERARDCGRTSAACAELIDGTFCAIPCLENRGCPSGHVCESIVSDGERVDVCLPVDGVCSDCFDPDRDGYGIGTGCAGGDCDEESPIVNEGAVEICDGIDQDCDTWADEDFNLLTDIENCGGCNVVCEVDNAAPVCSDGECEIAECDLGWGDCNDDPRDGCETDLTAEDSCGTCADLGGALGTACGTCGDGVWTCNEEGTADCVGDPGADRLNGCGGCNGLEGPVGEACGTCGSGAWSCSGSEFVVCSGDGGDLARNECGGCSELSSSAGELCGTCDTGRLACVSLETIACDGDMGARALNECGGCALLSESVGDSCGTCGLGEWLCDGVDALRCAGDPGAGARNACGGCAVLEAEPDTPCGTCGSGAWTCSRGDALVCVGDGGGAVTNSCGGCAEFEAEPGESCGPCGLDRMECLGPDTLVCGGTTAVNACGGCTGLEVEPGTPCGSCSTGEFVCDPGLESTSCADDDNCPPSQPSVEIVPTFPTALDSLTCNIVVGSFDPDGDPISYEFAWERRGVPDREVSDTVDSASLGIDDEWVCQATPTDGMDAGLPGRSAAVTIADPCTDGVENGNETDIDCGGPALTVLGAPHSCDRCAIGDECLVDPDCLSGSYCDGVCRAWECLPSSDLCVGSSRFRCDDRGSDSTFLETCLLGCDAGACIVGCGDGVLGAGEVCDDGAGNSDSEADACRTDCTEARCGDGVVDTGEVCDDAGAGTCSDDCSELLTGTSCRQLRVAGAVADGSYLIDPDGAGPVPAQNLYCDMTTDGGGWALTYIVRNDVASGSNPYWRQVVPGSGSAFPTGPSRPGGFFDGPTLATRSQLFDATGSTEWRATQVSGATVLFDVKSSWAGTSGIGLRCFATGQGACASISQTCSSSSTDAVVLTNTSGTPIAAGGTGHVCDVGWSGCSYCVDWSSIRTDSSAGGSSSAAYRYTGDSAISATSTQTYYWIR